MISGLNVNVFLLFQSAHDFKYLPKFLQQKLRAKLNDFIGFREVFVRNADLTLLRLLDFNFYL